MHGEWKISVQNNIVLQWFSGYWNEEAAITYSQEFLEKTHGLIGKPWAIMSFLNDWDLAIPDAEPHILEHTERLKRFGCVKHCQIYTPAIMKDLQLNKMCAINSTQYERKTFDDNMSGLLWLKSHGFEANLADFISKLPEMAITQ